MDIAGRISSIAMLGLFMFSFIAFDRLKNLLDNQIYGIKIGVPKDDDPRKIQTEITDLNKLYRCAFYSNESSELTGLQVFLIFALFAQLLCFIYVMIKLYKTAFMNNIVKGGLLVLYLIPFAILIGVISSLISKTSNIKKLTDESNIYDCIQFKDSPKIVEFYQGIIYLGMALSALQVSVIAYLLVS
ncbi:MAG: hypothetical protein ACK518_01345 [bacterium]